METPWFMENPWFIENPWFFRKPGACAIEKYFKILFLYSDRDGSYYGAFYYEKVQNIEKTHKNRSDIFRLFFEVFLDIFSGV